tara:strand:- start:96 stop:338 length:243 start_codon:yes stop_codon:yes gene_type:complete
MHKLFGDALPLWWVCTPHIIQKTWGDVSVLKVYSVMDSIPLMTSTSSRGTEIIPKPLSLLHIEQLQRIILSSPFAKKTSN